MARFFGEVGYGESIESPEGSGVWIDVIVEQSYYGDVIRKSRTLEEGVGLNNNIIIDNSVSIVADEYAIKHFSNIKYVRLEGVLWTVITVEVRSPRLILNLGSVYNGPVAIIPDPIEP